MIVLPSLVGTIDFKRALHAHPFTFSAEKGFCTFLVFKSRIIVGKKVKIRTLTLN